MAIKVSYSNQSKYKIPSYKKTFGEIARFVYKHMQLKGKYELSVTFIDDILMKEYNATYRGIDKSTDVLSFALIDEVEGENKFTYDDEMEILLGDIFISYETAVNQAIEYRHGIEREIPFLFTHGLLHLLGYDHMNKEDETIMFSLQDQILDALDIKR